MNGSRVTRKVLGVVRNDRQEKVELIFESDKQRDSFLIHLTRPNFSLNVRLRPDEFLDLLRLGVEHIDSALNTTPLVKELGRVLQMPRHDESA